MNHVGTPSAVQPSEAAQLFLESALQFCYVKHVKQMLGIRLEPELEEKLDSLAKETGRSKSYYAREAIRQYLGDREDYLKGIAALERREPTITLEELERRLGLDD
jgi:RHH-type transcriptional regulator, rel operon repressor / antitoxin RelB